MSASERTASPPGRTASAPPAALTRSGQSSTRSAPGQSILRSSQYSTASTTTSIDERSSSMSSFFRSIWQRRNNDYRADHAPSSGGHHEYSTETTSGPPRSTGTTPSLGASSQASPPSEEGTRAFSNVKKFFSPSESMLNFMESLMNSNLYRILAFLFTILLLFGAQIQALWIPLSGDLAMDVMYTIALAFFSLEIFMRIYLEPLYFSFLYCNSQHEAQTAWGHCHLGSFLFWCDLVSTLTLLYTISFINPTYYRTEEINIGLNAFGVPTTGLNDVNKAIPVEREIELLVLIGRTARVARFIRRSTVQTSGHSPRINWYYLTQRLNPFYYFDKFRSKRRKSTDTEDVDRSTTTHARDESLSWSTLQLAIMVKSRHRNNSERKKQGGVKGLWVKASMGLFGNENEELRREMAAIRIQRAWRARVAQHQDFSEHVAWSSQRGGPSKMRHRSTTLQSLQRQRPDVAKKFDIPKSVHSTIVAAPRNGRSESQVGGAMRELTGQRVALGIIIALVLTVIFTYSEVDATRPSAMILLHNQTGGSLGLMYANRSLEAARSTSIPDLYRYDFANGSTQFFQPLTGEPFLNLRDREKVRITVSDEQNATTLGMFSFWDERHREAWVEVLSTFFILFVWFFGVTAFAGPVMTLVVVPIERMVRLLGMLMVDPLGYQSTSRYKKFVAEEDELTKNTRWTKEVLKGMETSFLMSTILRIGSLMKVGFGSAGVEIIRNNLEKGQSKNMLILNSQGSTVSCIFLFCDIRQFTDATECLQEEVFVFTNRIAGVVHSYCNAYGGSANKNIGDAFLLSWPLDEPSDGDPNESTDYYDSSVSGGEFSAKNAQADKCLLSVVKICIALQHDKYYLEPISETAREALLAKVSHRKGPVVQLGFGLHAGKAVQGAIGSQRKIDATYVSEAVERAEFLESSTKKYGLKMLMSDSFHRLLHASNRRRCRKIDQIYLKNDDDDEEALGDSMELFTFDMDIDALWRPVPKTPKAAAASADNENGSDTESVTGSRREMLSRQQSVRGGFMKVPRRRSITRLKSGGKKEDDNSDEMTAAEAAAKAATQVTGALGVGGSHGVGGHGGGEATEEVAFKPPELVLPTGSVFYNSNVWLSDDMRRIRQLYSDGLFFQNFNSGFLAYYARDWESARQCFQTILERFEDGPSRYFLRCIEENNGVPPRDFHGHPR